MQNVLIYLLSAGAAVFGVTSWWGVRKLQQKHTRSTVAEPAHRPSPGPQKVAVILNPIKVRAAEARILIQRATARAGWKTPDFYETTPTDPGHSQARRALADGADVILVGGGDGTVRVVGQELAHTRTAMGLIPLGTGNLLARNLNLDINDLHANIDIALFGYQRFIDTATMKIENTTTGGDSTHTFLVMSGLGMDAEVVGDTNDGLKKSVGWLAYSEAGLRHLPGPRRKVGIELDDKPEQSRKIRSVLFANCGLIPGGLDFIPEAMIDDGVLDVVVLSPRSALGWIAMYAKIVFKHSRHLPVMDFYRSSTVTITSAEPVQTQLDGDPSGLATRVTAAVEPKSLLVRVRGEADI